jgi:hypothetical protein
MKDQLITTLASVAGMAVLVLAGIVTGTASSRAPVEVPMPALVESIEREALDAAADADALKPTPKRRVRPSLSMPYFSFAQSLRPRG